MGSVGAPKHWPVSAPITVPRNSAQGADVPNWINVGKFQVIVPSTLCIVK